MYGSSIPILCLKTCYSTKNLFKAGSAIWPYVSLFITAFTDEKVNVGIKPVS